MRSGMRGGRVLKQYWSFWGSRGGLRALEIFSDQAPSNRNVRFSLIATELVRRGDPPLCAISGITQRSKFRANSISEDRGQCSVPPGSRTVNSEPFAGLARNRHVAPH